MVQFEDHDRGTRRNIGGTLARGEKAYARAGWFDWASRLFGSRQDALIGLLALLFPNFQLFNIADWAALDGATGWGALLRLTAYASGYVIVACGLASWLFNRREI